MKKFAITRRQRMTMATTHNNSTISVTFLTCGVLHSYVINKMRTENKITIQMVVECAQHTDDSM